MARNRTVWLVTVLGSLLGLSVLAYYGTTRPDWVGITSRVYHAAAMAVLDGTNPYTVTPPNSGFHYLYPPITILAFLPAALVGSWIPGYVALTLVSVVATVITTQSLVQYLDSIGYAVPLSERTLIGGLLLVSPHAAPSLVYGQVNHLLVAAVAVGVVALESERETVAGVTLALPAFVKIVPGGIGLWMLARRSWRAIATAVATALALTVAGLVVFGPDTYRQYVVDALLPRRDPGAFVGGLDPTVSYVTLRRPLSVLFPGVDPVWYAVGAASLLLPILAILYWDVETVTDRLVAIHATLVATIIFFPSLLVYGMYLLPTTVLLLYDLPKGRIRQMFVAGAVLSLFSFALDGLRDVLAVLPLGSTARSAIESALVPVLTFGTPVLWGSLVMLAACLAYRAGTVPLARTR